VVSPRADNEESASFFYLFLPIFFILYVFLFSKMTKRPFQRLLILFGLLMAQVGTLPFLPIYGSAYFFCLEDGGIVFRKSGACL
jgi:hypothetical protein